MLREGKHDDAGYAFIVLMPVMKRNDINNG